MLPTRINTMRGHNPRPARDAHAGHNDAPMRRGRDANEFRG